MQIHLIVENYFECVITISFHQQSNSTLDIREIEGVIRSASDANMLTYYCYNVINLLVVKFRTHQQQT